MSFTVAFFSFQIFTFQHLFCLSARTYLYQLKPSCFLTSHALVQQYLGHPELQNNENNVSYVFFASSLKHLEPSVSRPLIYLLSREEMGNWINMKANHAGPPNTDSKGKITATCILSYMGLWMIGGLP